MLISSQSVSPYLLIDHRPPLFTSLFIVVLLVSLVVSCFSSRILCTSSVPHSLSPFLPRCVLFQQVAVPQFYSNQVLVTVTVDDKEV